MCEGGIDPLPATPAPKSRWSRFFGSLSLALLEEGLERDEKLAAAHLVTDSTRDPRPVSTTADEGKIHVSSGSFPQKHVQITQSGIITIAFGEMLLAAHVYNCIGAISPFGWFVHVWHVFNARGCRLMLWRLAYNANIGEGRC
jgi:hypothetical protein